jgi:carbamoyl-phosphate synthase small subunit
VVGVSALDTRGLVRHLRTRGVMRGALTTELLDAAALAELARAAPDMNGADLVRHVTCEEPYHWHEPAEPHWYEYAGASNSKSNAYNSRPSSTFHVVAYDYGIKHNILRLLTTRGCHVSVVPAETSASDVLALKPDGIFLSNGPGDPAAVTYAVESVRALIGRAPILGICLGHQIVSLALGGETYKLKFGHRGVNQPVKNLRTGQVEITTHNHGFAVRSSGLPPNVEITHVNLNDDCVEGLSAPDLSLLSAQFHPESAGGTHDALGLFDEFVSMMSAHPLNS